MPICILSLVLIAQAVFLSERGETGRQTNKQTDATELPTHASGYTAGVQGNNNNTSINITTITVTVCRAVGCWKVLG